MGLCGKEESGVYYRLAKGVNAYEFVMEKKDFQPHALQTELRKRLAINVLNKPQWGLPNTNINSAMFGRITTATGSRMILLNGRVDF